MHTDVALVIAAPLMRSGDETMKKKQKNNFWNIPPWMRTILAVAEPVAVGLCEDLSTNHIDLRRK